METLSSKKGTELFKKKFNGLKFRIGKALKSDPEFTRLILKRHKLFWGNEENGKSKLPMLFRDDSLSKWKNGKNWQKVLSHKGNSREFATMCGCRLPRLYWRGNNFNDLNFMDLPGKYVIRPTTGTNSRMVFLMDGVTNLFDGLQYTSDELISKLSGAIVENPNLEFLFEEFLEDENPKRNIMNDYKFYMFNGEVACIRVINRKSPKEGENRYYNEKWELLPTIKNTKYTEGSFQSPPDCLEEMTSFAKRLSKECEIFMRVDLYATSKGAVFGEFATTPSHGLGYSRSGSKFLMTYWNTHCKGMI